MKCKGRKNIIQRRKTFVARGKTYVKNEIKDRRVLTKYIVLCSRVIFSPKATIGTLQF